MESQPHRALLRQDAPAIDARSKSSRGTEEPRAGRDAGGDNGPGRGLALCPGLRGGPHSQLDLGGTRHRRASRVRRALLVDSWHLITVLSDQRVLRGRPLRIAGPASLRGESSTAYRRTVPGGRPDPLTSDLLHLGVRLAHLGAMYHEGNPPDEVSRERISAKPVRAGASLVTRIPGRHAGGARDLRLAARARESAVAPAGPIAGVDRPGAGLAVAAMSISLCQRRSFSGSAIALSASTRSWTV